MRSTRRSSTTIAMVMMTTTASNIHVFPEPGLEFRFSQKAEDPHDGLSLFGPYDADTAAHPQNISYGVVGTVEGINRFQHWSELMQSAICSPTDVDRRLWPTFPGFTAAFACSWAPVASLSHEVDDTALLTESRNNDANKRATSVVNRYLRGIERMQQRDEQVDVVVCVVPDIVHTNCRPLSRVTGGVGDPLSRRARRERQRGQLDIFDAFEPEVYHYSVDFRRQLKARSMEYGIPIQIVRESTLLVGESQWGGRRLTPLSDRAWNLGVALYYKAGGKPWRLSTAREGVCYVGLAYKRQDPTSPDRTACCAAQMFLDTGDGIVFMGKYGPWYAPESKQFHIERDAARQLLEDGLRTYQELEGQPLREIFLHCRSGLDDEEFAGFREACPPGVRLIGVRVRQERFDVCLFREGTRPVFRGTFWQVNERSGYLWASGFKPHLGTYDGWETPVPLRIDLQHGEADLNQVAADILGLTKLNYNACKLGDGQPVTVGFSDAVGEILVSNPTIKERSPKFRFYI